MPNVPPQRDLKMNPNLSLKIKAKREELDRITAAIEDLGGRENWSPDLVFRVNLVLEELGLNIMDHGRLDDGDGSLHEIEITLTSEEDALVIQITDDGIPFDPLNDAPPPDLDGPIEDRLEGGLGVHLVRTMMDEMRYRRDRGKNHLTLVTQRLE